MHTALSDRSRTSAWTLIAAGALVWTFAAGLARAVDEADRTTATTAIRETTTAAPPAATPAPHDLDAGATIALRPYPPAPPRTAPPADALPADASAAIAAYDKQQAALRAEVEAKLAPRRAELIAQLAALQDKYARNGQLDEAIAIRDRVRALKRQAEDQVVNGDPGTLANYRDRVGRSFSFELVGDVHGTVWGTDQYTDDSSLATAAVHAGLLRDGERGVVRVTVLPGGAGYVGSERNGVGSQNWGQWQGSFRFER